MRKPSPFLLLALLAALVLGAPGAGTSAADQAAIDPQLAAALTTATEAVEVVVTFQGEGAPTAADVAALRAAGISTGRTFQALPMAGVLATAAQVEALAVSPEVASLYLTGSSPTRTRARLRSRASMRFTPTRS